MRKPIVISFIIVSFIRLYWAKCQLGINLLSDIAWEDYFTFLKVLQRNEYLAKPKSGLI